MTRDEAVPTDHGWARKHENWGNGRVFRNHAPFVLNGFLTQPSLKKTRLLGISGEEGFFWPLLYEIYPAHAHTYINKILIEDLPVPVEDSTLVADSEHQKVIDDF